MSGFLAGLGVDIHPLLSLSLSSSFPFLVFAPLLGLSLVDRLLGDDEDAGDDDEDDDDLGAADDDDFFNADEDLGELEDDDLGDETFDDEFDQGGGGGTDPATPDLEPRLDELESEVEGISSTISTVRSENEAIGESVQEVEENVRKLLDIYEMVTRGVNPFVDDAEGQPFDPDSFGLFGGEQSPSEEDESIDDEVMDADPDSFFDEDFDGEEMDDGVQEEATDGFVDEPEEDEFEDDSNGSAKTFDDLKAEYERGEDWEDEADAEEEGFEFDQTDEATVETEDGESVDEFEDAREDEWIEAEEDSTDEWTDGESESVAANGGGPATEDDNKPYLTKIPDGYTAELTVLEWMDYLRNHADTAETLRAIEYYRNIGWINDRVADDLTEVVMGFERNGHHSTDSEHNLSELTIDDHTHSLQYISQLDGGTVDMELITNWPARGE